MSIQEIRANTEPDYQICPSLNQDSSYTLVDTVNQRAVTTLISESDKSDDTKSKHDLLKELALLKGQLSQMQVSTYRESLGIIQQLTEQNKALLQEKEALSHMLIAEQDKFQQLKSIVEPTLKQVMEDVTQNLVTKLMARVPDLNEILKKSTKEDGTVNFKFLKQTLKAQSQKEKEIDVDVDDDLCKWQEIVEVDIEEAFKSPLDNPQLLPLTYNAPKNGEKKIISSTDKIITQQSIFIPEVKDTEFDQLIDQLELLEKTYGENPSFHAVKTEEYIIIDGEKLDKEGALSRLVTYMGMAGNGVCIAGKSTFWMVGTVVQLASFVGLGFSIFASPWTAAFLLLGRFSYPILRVAVGI